MSRRSVSHSSDVSGSTTDVASTPPVSGTSVSPLHRSLTIRRSPMRSPAASRAAIHSGARTSRALRSDRASRKCPTPMRIRAMIAPASQIITGHAVVRRVRVGSDWPELSDAVPGAASAITASVTAVRDMAGMAGAFTRRFHPGKSGESAGTAGTAPSAHVHVK